MQKLPLIFLLVMCPFFLLAQARTQIKLETAERATGNLKINANYLRKPVFSHDGAILTCDSAVYYDKRNYFEAFGNVHINQGDSLNIYSDFLNYDGNAKKAHLDRNVRLLDRENTLTTNILDYNMLTRIGEYKTGGKLVNKDATITSREGYYFANTKDAYFKIDVLVVTPESTITSENLRYNTGTNWTYFYGPTNIKSKQDKLYTENGAYNTKSENAYFGKKNLYTNGSRSLKGDSLYYYGKTGYGKAVKNITFRDTKDQTLIRGQLGEYYREAERIVVTQKAYVGIGTKDSIEVNKKKIPDTLWLGADTLQSEHVLVKNLTLLAKPMVKKDNEIGTEDEAEKEAKDKEKAEARKQIDLLTNPVGDKKKENQPKNKKNTGINDDKKLNDLTKTLNLDTLSKNQAININDSLLNSKDKIIKQIDSTKADVKKLSLQKKANKVDSVANVTQTKKKTEVAKNNLSKVLPKDSITSNPLDTVKARTISAFHNVRVYKSNLQAKADSIFYSAADSTLRWYKNPILWSNGTQQTGDTIYVFFKNDKIHNFQVLHNGFIVNQETDSTKFNQVKGKIITGFFTDGELKNMYVDGNAESIYFTKNDKNEFDNVSQTVSSRLRFRFKDKELTDIVTVREVEGAVDPIHKVTGESILTGFIWKPELRPTSKQDIINGPSTTNAKAAQKKNTSAAAKSIPKTSAKKTTTALPAAKLPQPVIGVPAKKI